MAHTSSALAVHLSIGQVYAFSVFRDPLVDRFDTSLTAIGVIFSISIVMLGLAAAFGGKRVERNGPRKAMFVSGVCWSGGFMIGVLGVATGQLWLVYLGYGFLGGLGLGIGYTCPVSTLIKWFPDRPGMATGIAIMGFGGGALIASPLSSEMLNRFADSPEDAIVPAFLALGAIYFVVIRVRRLPLPLQHAGAARVASTSDAPGRKRTYIGYLGLGALLYLLIAVAGTSSVVLFVAVAGIILSFYGGGFATVPAYLKDLFGTYNVGAIHGRLLTAWSLAGIAGPMIVNGIADFQLAAGRDGPELYELSLYIMLVVMAVGFVANMLIRPLPAETFHEDVPAEAAARR